MPTDLVWTPQALEDLMDIYVAIGLDSPQAAERVYSTLQARVELLPDFPRMGPPRPDIAPEVRMLVQGAYLVLYELCPDREQVPVERIEIVRIVDGRRELRSFLSFPREPSLVQ